MRVRTTRPRRTLLGLESLSDRITPSATHLYAVGQDIGGTSSVRVYHEDGTLARSIDPFGTGFTGGVRVTTGDVTGDGTDDIVVAAGIGGGPEVKVYDGATGVAVRDFFAYDPGFLGGVNIAAGDINGDGVADIVVGTGVGGGPNVKAFDGATGALLNSFFAYESSFRGGVNVAVGDVNGDGRGDIVTGTGAGGGPRVQVFDAMTAVEMSNFFAYDSNVRSGVTVAAGDLTGDGTAEIVTGAGFGNGPNVKVFGGTGSGSASFYAYDSQFRSGVAVGVVTANGANRVLVTPGPSYGGFAELFAGDGTGIGAFEPFPGFTGGITTGQGVATAAAPLNSAFARPLAILPTVLPGSQSNGPTDYSPDPGTPDGSGFISSDPDDDPDDSTPSDTVYTPIDTGYYPTDSGSVASDPGTSSSDPVWTGDSGESTDTGE